MLKSYKIYTCTNGILGLHLSRAPWDPYPWVSSIQKDSTSYRAGLRTGDCLLELNSQDVLGMKISEIAALLKNHWLNESSNYVTVVIWRNKHNRNGNNDCNEAVNNEDDNDEEDEDEENNAHNINQQSLQKFATCLQHIAQLLECPVCLEVIKPPGWQCCNGHVLCNNCRSRSEKCPVCRVPLGPRGRCLLSDKLFTLLADSFPCDGVRSNKNSPKDRRKCSTELHNQPKMAIVQKQLYHHQQQQQQQEKDEQHGAKKAKDFLFSSSRYRRRKISSYKTYHDDQGQGGEMKEEENKHSLRQKQAMHDINSVVVVDSAINVNKKNLKLSLDYKSEASFIDEESASDVNVKDSATTFRYNKLQGQTSTIQQCHCITCFKLDKVAILNNVTATAMTTATPKTTTSAVDKYLLQIPSQGNLVNIVQQQQQEYEEKYKSYQCPTGKLCCLNVNMMPPTTVESGCAGTTIMKQYDNESVTSTNVKISFCESMTKNDTSTTKPILTETVTIKQTTLMTAQQRHVNHYKFIKILKNEWDILAHLTEDHQLPVSQYYAEYGQSILVHQHKIQQHSIACLNLRGTDANDVNVEKFFLAFIPLEMSSKTNVSKVAVFMYHMNSLEDETAAITSTSTISITDEVSNFETIIENPLTGIKWFGRAHPLTTPWSDIYEKQHFLQHNVFHKHSVAVSVNATAASSDDDVFAVVVNRIKEMKPKIQTK